MFWLHENVLEMDAKEMWNMSYWQFSSPTLVIVVTGNPKLGSKVKSSQFLEILVWFLTRNLTDILKLLKTSSKTFIKKKDEWSQRGVFLKICQTFIVCSSISVYCCGHCGFCIICIYELLTWFSCTFHFVRAACFISVLWLNRKKTFLYSLLFYCLNFISVHGAFICQDRLSDFFYETVGLFVLFRRLENRGMWKTLCDLQTLKSW